MDKLTNTQTALYYFLLGFDFTEMLAASDRSVESIDEIVEEALKYNTGEKPMPAAIKPQVARQLKIYPEPFREAVEYVLDYYWGHKADSFRKPV